MWYSGALEWASKSRWFLVKKPLFAFFFLVGFEVAMQHCAWVRMQIDKQGKCPAHSKRALLRMCVAVDSHGDADRSGQLAAMDASVMMFRK